MPDALAPRQRGGGGEEHEVAARHECIGDALLVERDFHVAGHGRFADLVEQAEAEQGILAELGGPRCGREASERTAFSTFRRHSIST